MTFKGGAPTKEQKTAIRDFFRNEYRGIDNTHRTLILNSSEDGEIKIDRLTAEVKDGDFLKLIDGARDRIPVAHGVPPRMLGIMSAGQLGGGGEVSGQLFTFEHLTLRPKRRRMLDQLRPVLSAFGLRPGNIDDGLGDNEVAFRPLDLTPPKDDVETLPDLVQSGIITAREARDLLPFLQTGPERDTESGPEGAQGGVSKSLPDTHVAALAALLAKV